MISGYTRICCLIGDPVSHSISPAMHNAAFKELGLDYIYLPFRVKPESLNDSLKGLRALGIAGFNVTIPHKVAIMPLLDKLDPLAEKIGAVNTVLNNKGVLKGFNTDGPGFITALKTSGIEPDGKKVVLLGAGGAARAIAFSLAESGAYISILNRRQEYDWAVNLATSIVIKCHKKDVTALELSDKSLKKELKDADILVNATPLGMTPGIENTPVAGELLTDGLTVFDIVYNPVETRLIREAKTAGLKTISGIDMLVMQGALAFEIWTGKKAPVALMKKQALKELK